MVDIMNNTLRTHVSYCITMAGPDSSLPFHTTHQPSHFCELTQKNEHVWLWMVGRRGGALTANMMVRLAYSCTPRICMRMWSPPPFLHLLSNLVCSLCLLFSLKN